MGLGGLGGLGGVDGIDVIDGMLDGVVGGLKFLKIFSRVWPFRKE